MENTIDLPEEDAGTVDRFFQFLYAGNYSDGEHYDYLPSIPAMMTPEDTSRSLNDEPVTAVISTALESDDESNDEDYLSESAMEENDLPEDDSKHSEYGNPDDLDEADESSQSENLEEYLEEYPITSLPISLRVYVMADKYDVPALKLLAKKRFTQTATDHWMKYDEFPAVVDELYESTVSNDPLRAFVCDLISCSYRHDEDLRVKMKPVMLRHSEFAIGVLDNYVSLYSY